MQILQEKNGNAFFPGTGSEADWNAAYYRLEDYFRALHLVNKVHQSQIILRLLQAAAARHELNPAQNPTTLAMEEAHQAMNQWFGQMLPGRERLSVVGVLSLLAVDAAERWPSAFMSEKVPGPLQKEILESDIRAGPDLQISSMVPRPIDVGPLLDTLHLAETLEREKWGVPILMVLFALGAATLSMLFLMH